MTYWNTSYSTHVPHPYWTVVWIVSDIVSGRLQETSDVAVKPAIEVSRGPAEGESQIRLCPEIERMGLSQSWPSCPRGFALFGPSSMLLVVVLLVATFGTPNTYAAETRRALLVGISDYEHIRDMDGPRNDVRTIRDLLVERWGFEPKDVRLLVDGDATKSAIVDELSRLVTESAPGDQLLVYFSGHGTSRLDPTSPWPLPHATGALIPVDFEPVGSLDHQVDQLLVGRWDLRPALERLDRNGVNVMVAVDACFSGNAARGTGITQGLQSRYVELQATPTGRAGSGPSVVPPADEGSRGGSARREPYPYSRVVFLSAAAEFEYAADIGESMLARFPTRDGQPHGAFSDGLARILAGELEADRDEDGVLSYSELVLALGAFMRERGYPQTPQLLPADTGPIRLVHSAVLGHWRVRGAGRSRLPEGVLGVFLPANLSHLDEDVSAVRGIALVAENADIALKKRGDVIDLLDARGARLDVVKREQAGRLRDLIRRERWLKKFSELGRRRGPSELSVVVKDHRKGSPLHAGQAITFLLRSDSDQYVTLLVSGADGTFSLLYPVDPSEVQVLQSGQQMFLPRPGSGDQITVTPPFGRNVVVAFGSSGPPGGLMTLMQRSARSETLGDEDLHAFLKLTAEVQSVTTLVLQTAPSGSGATTSVRRSR